MQQLPIPMWKWEDITIDFITTLPRTTCGLDTIWVIVERLNKSAHFIPIVKSISAEKLVEIYIRERVVQNGLPVSVVSTRDVRFTSRFWMKFHEELGTQLDFCITYHPQTDGKGDRTI